MGTRYDEGDVVATPDGRGVVAAVLTDDFEFPQGIDETVGVDAREHHPGYVVGLERGGSAVFRASSLKAASFEDDDQDADGDGSDSDGEVPDVDGEAETDVVDEDVDGLENLPDGWDRGSVLSYWSSIGGTWESAVDDLTDEFGEDRAERLASAMKDELLRTERWRNRF